VVMRMAPHPRSITARGGKTRQIMARMHPIGSP
jgi:hypothetical protein